jgi:LAO/AO transport system kinase
MMRRPLKNIEDYIAGIRAGDRVVLGQTITLVESAKKEHQAQAQQIIEQLLHQPKSHTSVRIGITGVPGVGKSTFIEAFGMYLISLGHKVAVLAIDPSSKLSKGSILGDKTRMERLSVSPMAFIRPSPSGVTLGGVAQKTRETILLVEAAGYDIILIETVGVGQSETMVRNISDLFLLLLLPGAGDELQGIKRGIVEMADILIVNKSDGDRFKLANQALAHYINATHLLPAAPSDWSPKVLTCSSIENLGFVEIWKTVGNYLKKTQANGFFDKNRAQQAKHWLQEALYETWKSRFFNDPLLIEAIPPIEKEIEAGRISPLAAAEKLFQLHYKNHL